jgi:anti-sigma B factor antagonist
VVQVATDDLAETHVHDFSDELFALVATTARPQLRLEMGAVRFLTSTALGKLLTLSRRVKAAGGHLVLAGLNDAVFEVFAVSRLDQLFDLRRGPSGAAARPAHLAS